MINDYKGDNAQLFESQELSVSQLSDVGDKALLYNLVESDQELESIEEGSDSLDNLSDSELM